TSLGPEQAELFLPGEAALPEFVPAVPVFAAILGNVFRLGLQREMRRRVAQVQEERLALVLPAVLREELHGKSAERIRYLIVVARFEGFTIEVQHAGCEVISPAAGPVGAVEATVHRMIACIFRRADAADVPLADMVGAVTRLVQQLRR